MKHKIDWFVVIAFITIVMFLVALIVITIQQGYNFRNAPCSEFIQYRLRDLPVRCLSELSS